MFEYRAKRGRRFPRGTGRSSSARSSSYLSQRISRSNSSCQIPLGSLGCPEWQDHAVIIYTPLFGKHSCTKPSGHSEQHTSVWFRQPTLTQAPGTPSPLRLGTAQDHQSIAYSVRSQHAPMKEQQRPYRDTCNTQVEHANNRWISPR